jgi:uncharacterized protein YPO0396
MPKEAANTALVEAKKVDDVWSKNTQFTMQDVTLAQFKAAMAACQTGDDEVEAKRRELTALINKRDAANAELTKLTTRARSGIRGFFGPDSDEYEQAGGTRSSERKKPVRKPKTTPPTTE